MKRPTPSNRCPRDVKRVVKAAKALSDVHGSSKQALHRYLLSSSVLSVSSPQFNIAKALSKGVKEGYLTQNGGRFQIAEKYSRQPRSKSRRRRASSRPKKSARGRSRARRARPRGRKRSRKAKSVRKVTRRIASIRKRNRTMRRKVSRKVRSVRRRRVTKRKPRSSRCRRR